MVWLISIVQAAVVPSNALVKVLDNGLTAVVVPQEDSSLVAVQTWMRVGARHESMEGTTGYAHFFEHLMFQGTESLSRTERKKELMLLAVDENAWTSQDFTCYHLLAPASAVNRILEIEADRFQHLVLDQSKVQREAGAVLGEFRKGRNSAEQVWEEAILAAAYKVHGYGHSTLGFEQDIRNMPDGLGRVQQFYQEQYRPSNVVVVVVGGIDGQKILDKIEAEFSNWEEGAPIRSGPMEEAQQLETRTVDIEWTKNPVQPQVTWRFKTPKPDPTSKDFAALKVLAHMLSSENSELYRDLVYTESPLARSVWARASTKVDPALFSINVVLRSAEDIGAVEERVLLEIDRLKEADSVIVEKSKSALLRQYQLSLTSPDRWAFSVGHTVSQYNDISALDQQMERIEKVTSEDIAVVLQKYVQPERMLRATLKGEVR
jgi:zinc protease